MCVRGIVVIDLLFGSLTLFWRRNFFKTPEKPTTTTTITTTSKSDNKQAEKLRLFTFRLHEVGTNNKSVRANWTSYTCANEWSKVNNVSIRFVENWNDQYTDIFVVAELVNRIEQCHHTKLAFRSLSLENAIGCYSWYKLLNLWVDCRIFSSDVECRQYAYIRANIIWISQHNIQINNGHTNQCSKSVVCVCVMSKRVDRNTCFHVIAIKSMLWIIFDLYHTNGYVRFRLLWCALDLLKQVSNIIRKLS